MRTLTCTVLAGLLGVLSLEAQPGGTLTKPSLPNPEKLHQMGLRQRWHASVPMGGARDRVEVAQAFDGQVLVQTASGGVVSLDAETGALQWSIRLGEPYRSQRLPAGGSPYTFCIVAGLKLYGIDRPTGLVHWDLDLPGVLSTAVGMDDTRFFLATADGGVYAYVLPLSRRALEEKFSKEGIAGQVVFNSPDPIVNPSSIRVPHRLWYFHTDAPVMLPPLVLPTHVAFANRAGVVYTFDRDFNKLGDRFYSRSAITAPIGQAESREGDKPGDVKQNLYVASQDYNVYNFELVAARLALRWQTTIHSKVLIKPAVIGPDLFVVGVDQGLFCLDRMDGAVRWRQPQAEEFLAASKRLVFAGDRWGNVLCLDRQKGNVLNTWDTRNWAFRLTNEHSDRLYLVNHDGQIVCLHDQDKEYAKPLKHNAPPPVKVEKKVEEGAPMEEKKNGDK
jgi:outer membrane protein assembly factor BamB